MKKKGLKSRPLTRKTAREYSPPKERGLKGPVFRWSFMLFVAAWMFVLGIIVGRYATPVNFDPKRIEKELAELRAAEIQKEKERLKAEAKALYDLDLDFYEDLKNPPRALAASGPSEVTKDDAPAPPPEIKRPLSTKYKASARSESKVVSPASPGPSRVSLPAKSPVQTAFEPQGESGRFAIQVASFVLASDADRTVAMLKKHGYAGAYRTAENIPGLGVRYRVRVGQFSNPISARGVLTRLRDTDDFRDAFILKQ